MLPHLSVHLTAHTDDRVRPLFLMARTIPSPSHLLYKNTKIVRGAGVLVFRSLMRFKKLQLLYPLLVAIESLRGQSL